jgi:predicted cupin superfamily sugar epimerase
MTDAPADPAPPRADPGSPADAPGRGPDATADPPTDPEVADLVVRLGMRPHPEGGWYAETWRPQAAPGERPAGTAIYYLLAAGQRSHWHRVDATEIWHHYAGAPLRLAVQAGDDPTATIVLGPDVAAGQVPQVIVPAGAWQAADPTGAWALAGCTVTPGFTFAGFEMAPPGWSPPR